MRHANEDEKRWLIRKEGERSQHILSEFKPRSLTFRVPAFGVRDSSKTIHKKGIIFPHSTEYCGKMSGIFPIFYCNRNIVAMFL